MTDKEKILQLQTALFFLMDTCKYAMTDANANGAIPFNIEKELKGYRELLDATKVCPLQESRWKQAKRFVLGLFARRQR